MIEKQFPLIPYIQYPIQNANAQELYIFSIVGQVLRLKFFSGETLLRDFSGRKLQMQYWTTKLSKLL